MAVLHVSEEEQSKTVFPASRVIAPIVAMIDRLVPKSESVVVRSFPSVADQARETARALEAVGVPVTYLVDDPGSPLLDRLGAQVIRARSVAGMLAYWRARVVVHTHGVYGSCKGAPGKVFVNIWHGMPIKRLQPSEVGSFQTDVTIATAEIHARNLRDTWSLRPEQVAMVGMPRNDLLVEPVEMPTWLRELTGGRPLVMWLPTFRRSVTGEQRSDGEDLGTETQFEGADLDAVDALMGQLGVFCLIKPHPLAEPPEMVERANLAVMNTSRLEDRGSTLYEVLAHADLLITDHSSVWVDFLLTGRPILFAISDLDQYADSRGFYFDDVVNMLPGPIVERFEDLRSAAEDLLANTGAWADRRRDALKIHHLHTDAHSAERVADLIVDSLGDSR